MVRASRKESGYPLLVNPQEWLMVKYLPVTGQILATVVRNHTVRLVDLQKANYKPIAMRN